MIESALAILEPPSSNLRNGNFERHLAALVENLSICRKANAALLSKFYNIGHPVLKPTGALPNISYQEVFRTCLLSSTKLKKTIEFLLF